MPTHPARSLACHAVFAAAEQFEQAYNFRFEEPGAFNIVTHPRNVSLKRRLLCSPAAAAACLPPCCCLCPGHVPSIVLHAEPRAALCLCLAAPLSCLLQIEGTVRKEDDRRKRQRAEKAERQAAAEEQRRAEVRRLKNLKKAEIEDK